jgi:hypothetical protein
MAIRKGQRMLRTAGLTAAILLFCSAGWAWFDTNSNAATTTQCAQDFVKTLTAAEKSIAVLPYDSPRRVDWHFIPKAERKGLQLKEMSEAQRDAAHRLLRTVLSEIGYSKATRIMGLEKLLLELEAGKGKNIRDPLRYFFTLFGEPAEDSRWGLSVEGHHLSLNFVVDHGKIISSTPQVFCSNPAVVMTENHAGIPVGTRILDLEETLAFELVNSLEGDQVDKGLVSAEPLKEVRDAGSLQPPTDAPAGIAYADLEGGQRALLLKLIDVYCAAMPAPIAKARMDRLHFDGLNTIHFAWMGATQPGQGHYYRIQGPSFLIEFVNTQPDAAGNPANHIHSIFRDLHGDFAVPIGGSKL